MQIPPAIVGMGCGWKRLFECVFGRWVLAGWGLGIYLFINRAGIWGGAYVQHNRLCMEKIRHINESFHGGGVNDYSLQGATIP